MHSPKLNNVQQEESYSYAMQLARSIALPMVLHAATELKVFDIIAKSGPDAKLSAVDIAAQITSKNPEAATMLDRVEHVEGDMFENVPKRRCYIYEDSGYFMIGVMKFALKVLKNCYDAVPQDGEVIVVETILPVLFETKAAAKNNSQLDIESMVNVGEKERTEQEFRVGNSN
ncbi:hypothetical protein L6164_013779 [Bauhinia variegata]|uniref:Uncharacterized protein n=1 Tax=Bauhinia variegata TaxID=167791 RepID=A0ACB9NG63_BAUVA|nr:hypothetical protein L6164_013779 [Bauhinia variegata]